MARRSHRLNVDCLEARDLMAGNLSAFVSNGILRVQEATGSGNTNNGVQVFRLPNSFYRVVGIFTPDATPTTVNGVSFQDFFVPGGKLDIRLGGGNDLVGVHSGLFNTVSINVGAANLADNDQVFVFGGVRTLGHMRIVTGGGADLVSVRDSVIGDGVGTGSEDLSIFTGAGADTVEVGSNDKFVQVAGRLRVATFSSVTEPDTDRIAVRSTHVGDLIALDMGAGNDTLTIENSTAADIVALTGTGDDKATLTEVRADDQFFVDMSAGNDTLDMVFLSATHLAINGGTGFDKLTKFLDGPTVTKSITGWESINGVTGPLTGTIGVTPGGGVLAQ